RLAVLFECGRKVWTLVQVLCASGQPDRAGTLSGCVAAALSPRAAGDSIRMEVTPVFHLNTGVFFCEDTFL
ncbi:MAG TPA: hypothetical protein VIR28_07895, partial [Achromobacter sp.]|uniref:hypothetical protein n=1 Tax=Achromobacter sp. TaxID=134375 RepID=UPI002F94DDA1